MAVTFDAAIRVRVPAERVFYLSMTLLLAFTVLVGFARSFFLRPLFPGWPSPSEPLLYVHGTVFAAWFALLVVQASLVTSGRIELHRKLGVFGACLVVAMVVLGTLGALVAAHRHSGFVNVPIPALMFLAVPLTDMLILPALVALAIVKRREPQSHKRLMLIASISLTAAAFARWPVLRNLGPLAFFGATDVMLVPLLAWDLKSRGRLHPVTLWAGAAVVLSQPLRLALAGTPQWLSFATWAVGLID